MVNPKFVIPLYKVPQSLKDILDPLLNFKGLFIMIYIQENILKNNYGKTSTRFNFYDLRFECAILVNLKTRTFPNYLEILADPLIL